MLKLQASDGVIRRVLFAESSPILCQNREGEGRVGGLINRAFFRYLGFRLRTVEGGTRDSARARARRGFTRRPLRTITESASEDIAPKSEASHE